MSKILMSGVGLLIALALFVSLNVLSGAALRTARVDLTENGLYTLSEGTRNILADLEEPITLRLYFSGKQAGDYPQIEAYARRVQDLLIEYELRAGGVLTVEFLDPEPFSETEERAIQYGLRGAPAGRAGELLYFGLVGTNSVDAEETIPFFQLEKENLLEYELTRMVHVLSDPRRGVVGVLSTLPIEGAMPNPMMGQARPPQPWVVMDQLREFFEVRQVAPTASEIPEEVEVLMIVHPKDLPDETLFAIDQFVLGGGKALVFVDPLCEADVPPSDPSNPMAAMTAKRDSSLGPLGESWGIRLAEGVFAADRANARRVTVTAGGRPEAVDYVAYLRLGADAMSSEDVVTSQLGTLHMANAGVLETLPNATTTVTPLIETSTESMRIQTTRIQFAADPADLLRDFFPTGERLLLAARVTGPATSAFPDGPPWREDGDSPDAAAEDSEAEGTDAEGTDAEGAVDEVDEPDWLTESDGPINVVIVADADLLEDRWWVQASNFFGTRILQPTADNGSLAINALDNLTGSSDLISLRGRKGYERPFDRVQELERRAEERFLARAQALEDELREAEERINQLQSEKDGVASDLILTAEQQAELENFLEKRLETKRELRQVRYELRKDIDRLGTWLKFLNIWLVPLMILATAIGTWIYRTTQTPRA